MKSQIKSIREELEIIKRLTSTLMSNDYFNHSLNEQARTIIYKINKVDD